jgi:hypothetical protein
VCKVLDVGRGSPPILYPMDSLLFGEHFARVLANVGEQVGYEQS